MEQLIIIGSVVNRTYDFCASGYIVNVDRSHFVDFSLPLFNYQVGNYINKRKQSISYDWLFFIRPFHSTVWFCCLGLFLLICIIQWVLHDYFCIAIESQVCKSLSFLFWAMFMLCQAYYW
jgi:hypothetical protein